MIRSPIQIQKKPAPQAPANIGDLLSMLQQFQTLFPQFQKMHQEIMQSHATLQKQIGSIKQGPPGPKGDRGNDGNSPDHKAVAAELVKLVKLPRDGKDGRHGRDGKSSNPNEVVEVLKKKKIKVEHVDGLEQTLSAIRNASGGFKGSGDTVAAGTGITITSANGIKTISAGSAVTTVIGEDLSSQAPGTTFTLAHTPTSGSVRLYRGGTRQNVGAANDYTISGATITFNTTVQSGEIIIADYTY